MNRKTLVALATLIAVVAFAAATWWNVRSVPVVGVPAVAPEISERLIRPYSPVFGPETAPVTIVEFFDPACEACRAFHPVVKDILAQYPEQVRVVIRYTPFHGESSERAIATLEAARIQGIYLRVMEALFDRQNEWTSRGAPTDDRIMQIAGSVGLNVKVAKTQVQMPDIVAIINQDRADVEAIGIRQTPTFFVNGKPLIEFGESQLRALVAAEVDAAGGI